MTLALFASTVGLLSWFTMNRQEDPSFALRVGYVLVQYPGAPPEVVERLVVDPLEEELAEIAGVRRIDSIARLGVALVNVELVETLEDTAPVWDRVRTAVGRARGKFPVGAGRPRVEDRAGEVAVAAIAVHGSADPLDLANAAERLKRELYQLPAVGRVLTFGDPDEQITVTFDDLAASRLGVAPEELARELAERNRRAETGLLRMDDRAVTLEPSVEFRSVEELARTPVRTSSGATVPLSSVAAVERGPREPIAEAAWIAGRERAVVLAVTVPQGDLDVVAFGARLRDRLRSIAPDFAPLEISEVVFQPDRVEARIRSLGRSLLLGMTIVTAVLVAALGSRSGLLVALVIPLVTFSALALFAVWDGVLHQVSIAGLLIALGMLVDNAIVMVESIQWHLDRGRGRAAAASAAVRELAAPLATATGTTIAAFLPMLLAEGATGDFTRAIPVVVITVMSTSYVYAVTLTPVLAARFLDRRSRAAPADAEHLFRRLAHFAVRRPAIVLGGLLASLVVVGWAGRFVESAFFPDTDRNQFIVDVRYPEGTYLERTADGALRIADALLRRPEVTHVATFAGNAGPRFFYNLVAQPAEREIARLVVATRTSDELPAVMAFVRDYARRELPAPVVVPRALGQGPPVSAPVEIRFTGWDSKALERAARSLRAALESVPGLTDVRTDLPAALPSVTFEIEDAVVSRHEGTRTGVGRALARGTLGLVVSEFRAGEDLVPIVLRGRDGLDTTVTELELLDVFGGATGEIFPVGHAARSRIEWRPGAIRHRNLRRAVTVMAELEPGETFGAVASRVRVLAEAVAKREGVAAIAGGQSEESGAANRALLGALPVGAFVLLFCLLLQFGSLARLLVILATVPLAFLGVVPGLLLTGSPLGFTALLGGLALMGIVVNNAIVLVDLMDRNAQKGMGWRDAVVDAVGRRARPILLTTATTVGGLLPLTFSSSTLWPPMAWTIVSGLLASVPVALVVVPALAILVLRPPVPETSLDGPSGGTAPDAS